MRQVLPDAERPVWTQYLHEDILGALRESGTWSQPLRVLLRATWASDLYESQNDTEGGNVWLRGVAARSADYEASDWQARRYRRGY